jgi:DNA-directed RNA polymerase subunit RPC12/RpoP
MKSFTFTLKRNCNQCGAMLPLNGPLRSVVCDQCQKTEKCTPSVWGDQICSAVEGMRIMNNPYTCIDTKSTDPLCAKCGKHFPLDTSVIGKDTFVSCPHCGEKMATFPAPDWLKKDLPGVVQLFNADREDEGAPRGADAVASAEEHSSRPVVLNCPSCSAALKISSASERVVPCEHCGSDVYLPDALWFKLHPVRTVRAWTMVYAGHKLETAEEIRERQAEQDEVRSELEWKEKEKASQKRQAEEDRARTARSTRLLLLLVLAGLIASGIIVALLALFDS